MTHFCKLNIICQEQKNKIIFSIGLQNLRNALSKVNILLLNRRFRLKLLIYDLRYSCIFELDILESHNMKILFFQDRTSMSLIRFTNGYIIKI